MSRVSSLMTFFAYMGKSTVLLRRKSDSGDQPSGRSPCPFVIICSSHIIMARKNVLSGLFGGGGE